MGVQLGLVWDTGAPSDEALATVDELIRLADELSGLLPRFPLPADERDLLRRVFVIERRWITGLRAEIARGACSEASFDAGVNRLAVQTARLFQENPAVGLRLVKNAEKLKLDIIIDED